MHRASQPGNPPNVALGVLMALTVVVMLQDAAAGKAGKPGKDGAAGKDGKTGLAGPPGPFGKQAPACS